MNARSFSEPPLVVVMGVSGSGKSTVGRRLAERLGVPFADADAYHPPANIAKMTRGEPLDDADRAPWLDTLRLLLRRWQAAACGGVLACSALRTAYRDVLDVGGVHFYLLDAPPEVLRERLRHRAGHFFDPALLDSQFATLEVTPEVRVFDAAATPPEVLVQQMAEAVLGR